MTKYLKYICLCLVFSSTFVQANLITFTSSSELDFEGDFAYALNFHGGGTQVVGDATFQNVGANGVNAPSGANISGLNRTYTWGGGSNLGNDANNNALENVLRTLIWADQDAVGQIDLAVITGTSYRLQLLFSEGFSSNRNYDVNVENGLIDAELLGSDFGGDLIISATQGYVLSADFVATDSVLDINLLRRFPLMGDSNYHISGLTLEKVPAPGLIGLFALAILGLVKSRGQVL